MKIVYWGTYDLGKPRNRILLRGIRENNIQVIECHKDLWQGIEDKSQLRGWRKKGLLLCRWLISYPGLILRYLKISGHDAVVIGYLGHLDVLVLWPFAKLRGVPIIWDAFLSLYDTAVLDRRLVGSWNPLAILLYFWEWLACRAADQIVLDTRAHADLFENLYGLPGRKLKVALVGVEPEVFIESKKGDVLKETTDQQFTILFYGQFIPLHGINTIIEAARELQDEPFHFVIIGKGQEEKRMRDVLNKRPLQNLKWIPWVDYHDLIQWILMADVCLGIFGETAKAARVIPNKVFQIIAAGKPLITRDSPAIRELLSSEMDPVTLVRANDPAELAMHIRKLAQLPRGRKVVYPEAVSDMIRPQRIGMQMKCILDEVVESNRR